MSLFYLLNVNSFCLLPDSGEYHRTCGEDVFLSRQNRMRDGTVDNGFPRKDHPSDAVTFVLQLDNVFCNCCYNAMVVVVFVCASHDLTVSLR